MSFARAVVAIFAICLGGGLLSSQAAAADATSWLCKPGQADNPCAGPLGGKTVPPPGSEAEPLDFKPAEKPKIDCFYVYPTQSSQAGPNANLDKDPAIRRVAVQQARQFSRICRVFAPMYRQYTLNQLLHITDESRDIAYGDVVSAWKDYLENYNHGRGVILIGHSQGSSHLARLLAEHIDRDPQTRKRLVSAIIPGANVYVAKGKQVGGIFQDTPACSEKGQINCVIAYSLFDAPPPQGSFFGRTTSGYWAIPGGAPDPGLYEVLCVNPAALDGSGGILEPLINTDYVGGVPAEESPAPWLSLSGYYGAECMSAGGATWLNVTRLDPMDTRTDLTSSSKLGHNLHTYDITLPEGNLVRVAKLQAKAYGLRLKRATARGQLANVKDLLSTLKPILRYQAKICRKVKAEHAGSHLVRDHCRPLRTLTIKLKRLRGHRKELLSFLRTTKQNPH